MMLCAGFGAALTATSIHTDVSKGFVERLRTMPIRASGVIFGHELASVLRNLSSTAIVLLVAFTLGFRPSATFLDWLGITALIAAYILVFTLIAAAWGLAANSVDSAGMFSFIALFLPYLSTAFIPTESLPGCPRSCQQDDALSGIKVLVADVLDDMQVNGEERPEAIVDGSYSGKFMVRVTSEAHRQLAFDTAEQQVSLNRLAAKRLASI